MSDERTLRFTCEEHGVIHEAAVACQHDAEAATRAVMDAHRASYGAACTAPVTAELLEGGERAGTTRHMIVPGTARRGPVTW